MPPISPRAELLTLQKKLFLRNKKIIDASVIPEERSFAEYERAYKKAVARYNRISSVEEVESALLKARIIFVGDYHTLNQSQRSFLRILRSFIKKNDRFCIGLEVVQSRHQAFLDLYREGKLSDQVFLNKIGFREHWFFDLWENFRPLIDFARYHHIPLYGVEANPQSAPTLAQRDRETAKLIFDIHKKNPDRKIFVFVGDLHLAPSHLPREVKKIFGKVGKPPPMVTLYQNSESIYWKLAALGKEDALVVRISKNEFCRLHTPPIIAQQSYLNWLEHEEGVFDYADAKQTFLGYLDQIAAFLKIKLGKEKEEVEVFTCGDLSFLKCLRQAKAFSRRELREIKRQILRSESYYIPKKKYVYLANVSINHAAEEASHTLKHLCAGEEFPRAMQDAFYANVLHEALGFFGSKIVNHKRKCLRPSDARRLYLYLKKSGAQFQRSLEYHTAQLFLDHERRVKEGFPFHANKISALSVDLFLSLTHAIGYYLGEKLFYGLLAGQISRDKVRALFFDAMEEEGDPVKRYFELVAKLAKIKLPKKV